jgi:hypothetical protein
MTRYKGQYKNYGDTILIKFMYATEVLAGLWIGDAASLTKTSFLTDNDITVLVNCTDIFDFPALDVIKVRIPFQAHAQSHENIALLQVNHHKLTDFLIEHLDHHNILIACSDGKCLAPLIVAIFILKQGQMSPKSIYEMLLTKDSSLSLWCDLGLFV